MTEPSWRRFPSARTRHAQSRTTMPYAAWVEAGEPCPVSGATAEPTDGQATAGGTAPAPGARRPLSSGWTAALADLRVRRGWPAE